MNGFLDFLSFLPILEIRITVDFLQLLQLNTVLNTIFFNFWAFSRIFEIKALHNFRKII